jgi:hypothetical protein
MVDEATGRSDGPALHPSEPIRHLSTYDVSRRWGVSDRTLERWRWQKAGPPYVKLGSHV